MAHAPENHQSYSNLEVVDTSGQDTFKYKAPEYASGPIALDPHASPEVVSGPGVANQPPMYPASQPTTVDTDKEVVSPPGKRRRRIIILGVLIGIVVIVGAVAGGILGSRHSKSAAENATPSQEPQPGDSEVDRQVLSNSKLAAVNWTSGDDNGVYYRAVFWQAVTNDLMASIWESDSGKWSKVNLTLNGNMDVTGAYNKQYVPPKAGTPLAATVRLHRFPQFVAVALFYLSEQNTVEQMNTNTITAKTGWGMCCLSNMANKKIAAQDSQLAAFTVACEGSQCRSGGAGDWIQVAFQAANNQIIRLTQQNWNNRSILTGDDVQPGTGLTMSSTGSPYSNDSIAFVPKMYLQTPKELQEKLWYPDSGSRLRIEGARTGGDGSPVQLSSAIIPASKDADAGSYNDLLLLSIASDGSQLLINQYTNQTGKNWTGSSIPELTKAPSTFNFTSGALIASPDEPRFVGLQSNGSIQSFKISLDNSTKWEYEGPVLSN